ncbi:MAG: hypothetical protein WC992_05890 [Acholeplasmataceae bacterium]
MAKLTSFERFGVGEVSELRKFGRGPVVCRERHVGGYRWSIDFGDGHERYYSTDRDGEGLWDASNTGAWQQLRGSGQFSLSSDPVKAKRQIVRRFCRQGSFTPGACAGELG